MPEITPIVTPYFVIHSENNQRRFVIDIHGDIKNSEHNKQIIAYCTNLISKGFRFNADNTPFEVDKDLRLTINKRRLDILYINDKNELVGVEVKTYGDVGTNHTAEQLRVFGNAVIQKKLQRFIFLVPADEEKNAREILTAMNAQHAVTIETY
jgi:hypothetical protein